MSNEILTADQYRNHRRIARYLARIGNHYDPLEHAQRSRRGLRLIARLHRLIQPARTSTAWRLPTRY